MAVVSSDDQRRLRREPVRLAADDKEFDEEIDFSAARRETSLAIDTLETLGSTVPNLIATVSSSSPRHAQTSVPSPATARRERSLPFESAQASTPTLNRAPCDDDSITHNLCDQLQYKPNENLQRRTKSYFPGVFGQSSPYDQNSHLSPTSPIDTLTRGGSAFVINNNKGAGFLARAATMRMKTAFNKIGSPSSLLHKSSTLISGDSNHVRKAGVFECPCHPHLALTDVRKVLEQSFRAEFSDISTTNELRAHVWIDTTKFGRKMLPSSSQRKKSCTIVVDAAGNESFCRLCIRRTIADVLRVDDETFDAICTQMFYKLSEVRQVVRPFFL